MSNIEAKEGINTALQQLKVENVRLVCVILKTKLLPRLQKKKPVDFDDELRIGDVRYDNMIQITFKVQLF